MRPEAGHTSTVRAGGHLAEAYRPLHRSVLIACIVYFSYVTVGHLMDETGVHLAMLASMSVLTVVCAIVVLTLTLRRALVPLGIEIANGALHLWMLGNVALYQVLHYAPAKLVYFPLLAVAFALSAISLRSVLVSVSITLGFMIAIVVSSEPAAVATYAAIGIATAFTTIGLSSFVRGVIEREVRARLRADKAAAEALQLSVEQTRLAMIDPLTLLPNRRRFFDLVERALSENPDAPAVIIGVVDLDGFKAVNDIFGHSTGDRVLVAVAERLSISGRLPAVISRMGGDEFGVLLSGDYPDSLVLQFADDLARSLQSSFRFEGAVAKLSGSFGFSRARRGDTTAALLERADYAAYEAKHHQRGGVVLFSKQHQSRIIADRELERVLLRADLEAEIFPVFQPIVDTADARVVGYEALARWRSVELGDVSPARFVPMAERLGLVSRITQAMTSQVLTLLPTLPEGTRVSINLSPRDLASQTAMLALTAILGAAPRPCRIDFEITETAIMGDIDEANNALVALMAFGARISLDDFGTGHSSLSRVQTLPLDRIKVDRSFVTAIETDRTSQAIVQTTIDLCRNLGVSCVIEGVETESQLTALLGLGARHMQGYLFGRPAPAAEIAAFTAPARLTAWSRFIYPLSSRDRIRPCSRQRARRRSDSSASLAANTCWPCRLLSRTKSASGMLFDVSAEMSPTNASRRP
jgi:diguanylate cyclase (GGDEF)-like protein